MPFWNTNSTTLDNEQMYVNNTYKDSNGNSKLSTITSTNKTGYIPIDKNATNKVGDNPPGLKGLSYAVQNDGKITYLYDDGTGNKTQYNSIQEIANGGVVGYNANTTAKIKNEMQKNLTGQVNSYNKANPTSKIGPAVVPPGTNPNAGAATTSQFTQAEAIAAIEGLDVRTSYRQDLSYPLNRNQKQDYIKFEMLEYSPRSFSGANLKAFEAGVDAGLGQKVFGDERLGGKDRKTLGAVSLPISSPISDTNSVTWGDDNISGLAALGQGAFMNLVGGPTTQSTEDKKTPPSESGSGATKALLVSELSKAAVGGAGGNLLTRATGAIINPNIELLFNGPSLRTFSFTFPLAARSKKESEVILQIIRFFKQGMSVKRSKSALFLKSPHTFRIKYVYAGTGKDHPWINKFKECALTNCSVNYTPAGNYATYANGAMTMYEITLNFSELEPIFDDDYKSLDGNSAGKDTMVGY